MERRRCTQTRDDEERAPLLKPGTKGLKERPWNEVVTPLSLSDGKLRVGVKDAPEMNQGQVNGSMSI